MFNKRLQHHVFDVHWGAASTEVFQSLLSREICVNLVRRWNEAGGVMIGVSKMRPASFVNVVIFVIC